MRQWNHAASGTLLVRAVAGLVDRAFGTWGVGQTLRRDPMCGTTARLASIVGVFSLALFTTALMVFPSLPTTGAGLSAAQGRVAVDRTHKGDRLPMTKPASRPDELAAPPLSPARTRSQGRIPTGCDPAFSPISSPQLGHVFRRCVV